MTCVLPEGECETLIGATLIGCPGCPSEVHFPARYNCTTTGLHLDGIAPRRDLYLDVLTSLAQEGTSSGGPVERRSRRAAVPRSGTRGSLGLPQPIAITPNDGEILVNFLTIIR